MEISVQSATIGRIPRIPGSSEQFSMQKWHSSSRKAPGSPCTIPMPSSIYPAETSFYVTEESSRSLWSSPCCRKLHRNRIPYSISTCNCNTSTLGQCFPIDYLFLEIPRSFILFWELILPSRQKHCFKTSK